MKLPNPREYKDPIRLLRESHRIILQGTTKLEELVLDAEKNGLYKSFADHDTWAELIQFFSVATPQHEEDEEQALFPVLKDKLPKIGFQLPDSPIHFLTQGHELMQQRTQLMVDAWHRFLGTAQDKKEADKTAAEKVSDAASQQDFISTAKELISLYRDHIKVEEESVYAIANNELSPQERIQILDRIRANHHNSVWMKAPTFDSPTFSSAIPHYTTSTDAVSGEYLESSENEEEDDT